MSALQSVGRKMSSVPRSVGCLVFAYQRAGICPRPARDFAFPPMASELLIGPAKWLAEGSGLTSNERLVFVCLCLYADGASGICWPSIASICGNTALSERTVQRAIAGLEQKKALLCQRGKGRNHASRYTLDGFPVSIKGATQAPFTTTKGVRNAVKGVRNDTEKVSHRHPNYSVNYLGTKSESVSQNILTADDGMPITVWRGKPSC